MTYPDQLIDKRVVERNISKGLVNRKEYERSIAELRDVADNSEIMEPMGWAKDDSDSAAEES